MGTISIYLFNRTSLTLILAELLANTEYPTHHDFSGVKTAVRHCLILICDYDGELGRLVFNHVYSFELESKLTSETVTRTFFGNVNSTLTQKQQ